MTEQFQPLFDLSYEVCPKGLHLFEVKETGIEETTRASGKRYWSRSIVVEGPDAGISHLESFFEKTKDHFSLRRLAGFLIKLGVIPINFPNLSPEMFWTDAFEENWKHALKGLKFGGKVAWRYADDDKEKENPQSQIRTFFTVAEYYEEAKKKEAANTAMTEALNPKPAATSPFSAPSGSTPGPAVTATPGTFPSATTGLPAQEPARPKAPWE